MPEQDPNTATTQGKYSKIEWDYSIDNPFSEPVNVFSYYTRCTSLNKIRDISVDEYIEMVSDKANKELFDELRALPEAEYKKTKKNYLEAITGCAITDTGHAKNNIVALNGLFVLDFDKLPDSFRTWLEFKQNLCLDPFAYIVHYSASGRGLCMFVKITNEHSFIETYKALEKYFLKEYEAVLDALKDETRLRFISYDDDIYTNQNSKIYTDFIIEEIKPKPEPKQKETNNEPPKGGDWSEEEIIKQAVYRIENALNGEKHKELVKSAYWLGGYIAIDEVDEAKAIEALENAIGQQEIDSFEDAQKTIRDGINKGKENPIKKKEEQRFEDINPFDIYKIDFLKELPPPPTILSLNDKPLFTLGNISVVTGKAKSKKTFLLTMFTGALINNTTTFDLFIGTLPEDKRNIILFDTEQSEYHALKTAKRILKTAGTQNPPNFTMYHLRKFNATERLKIIESIIYQTKDLGFIVIDGIRDLINSINDEAEATMITSKLLKWSEELNVHILCVLHQNKTDGNIRGTVGTEFLNKAETVLSVMKDRKMEDVSVVTPEVTRDIEPKPFGFSIDNYGNPYINTEWSAEKPEPKAAFKIEDVSEDELGRLIMVVFDKEPIQKYGTLIDNIKKALKANNVIIGDNAARKYKKAFEDNELLFVIGKKPNTTYSKTKPKELDLDL